MITGLAALVTTIAGIITIVRFVTGRNSLPEFQGRPFAPSQSDRASIAIVLVAAITLISGTMTLIKWREEFNRIIALPQNVTPISPTPTLLQPKNIVQAQGKSPLIYYVNPNETLALIAGFYGISKDDIIEFNEIQNEDLIVTGTPLNIPLFEHTVGVGENATYIAAHYGIAIEELQRVNANKVANLNKINPGDILWIPFDD